jgi:hypothetical protein
MSIKEKLPLLNSDSKGTRMVGYVVYAFVGLMVLGAILPSPDTGDETTTTTTAAAIEEEDDGALDEQDVKDLLGWSHRANIESAGPVVVLTREMSSISTPDWETMESIEIFKALFKDPRIMKVTIKITAPMVDVYGQESMELAIKYRMTREIYEKINWDYFDPSDLCEVADECYIHPDFQLSY